MAYLTPRQKRELAQPTQVNTPSATTGNEYLTPRQRREMETSQQQSAVTTAQPKKVEPKKAAQKETTLMQVSGIPGVYVEVPKGTPQMSLPPELLSRGLYATAGAVKAVKEKQPILPAIGRGLAATDKTTFADVLPKLPDKLPSRADDPDVRTQMALLKSSPELARPEFGQKTTATLLDMLGDPLSYVGIGIGKKAITAGKSASKAVGELAKSKLTQAAIKPIKAVDEVAASLPKTATLPPSKATTLPASIKPPAPAETGLKLKPVASAEEAATASTADAFRAKINRTPTKTRKSFSETMENLRTQFVDDVAPLEGLEKRVRGKVASAEDSLYKTARLFRGAPTKANEVVRTRLAPIIQGIEKQGGSYQDLGDYALAVHAKAVNAKGINSGFTDGQIDAVIAKYGTPEMEAARKELVKLSDDLLGELAEAQVISKDTVKTLKDKWPDYMPLFRAFDDEKVEFAKGLSNALANVTSPIKKLEGSSRDVIDPIESMVKNVFQTTNVAERNKVALQLAKLAEDDAASSFIRKLETSEEVGRKNVVSVLQNGERVKYEVEPEVYKAMLNLDKESSALLVKILQKPASILRAGATLTPEFSLRNPMRDIAQAFMVSESGFNPIVDFPLALVDAITKGNLLKSKSLYSEWLKANGGYGNIVSMDRNVHREALEKVLKQPIGKKFVNIVNGKSFIGMLRAIADAGESATKLGEFRAAIRKGVSPAEAAYRARDVMDFSRAGYSIREANKMVAFLNANIQGKSKLLRAIRANPAGVTARGIVAVTMPTIAIYAAQRTLANDVQKATINDAPQWLKSTFWLVPIPGTDLVGRIPKPFDVAPIFANAPERLMEYIIDKDPKAFDGFVAETLGTLSIPTMMTGLLPIVEGMANYSFFRQSAIIPQREQGLEYPDQYDINTSETGKLIAKGVNRLTGGQGSLRNFGSPRVIDNTIRGITAGLGDYGVTAVDAIIKGVSQEKGPKKPKKDITQAPLIKSFLVNKTTTGESVNYVYDERERLTKAKGSAKANKVPFKETAKLNYIEGVTERIGNISKAMRDIQNSKTLDAATKRQKLDALNEKRNDIAREARKKLQK